MKQGKLTTEEERRKQEDQTQSRHTSSWISSQVGMSTFYMKPSPNRKSYAGALTNNANATPPPTPITIHSCPHLTTRLSTSLVGELITLETLPNLTSIFKNSGLFNTRLNYLGRLHILIELPTDTNA
nr:RNA-directed DNA polymerase, eukaryota [Tanacetum cinerariifolium]